ncbi:kinesin-like protein KIF20A isoform X1 [Poecilia latipinna]|uniref:kinesin-like protein KIF20A isoform X1 n=1 Tax=Poecilia latipinna TaxID=48699 RepID=UPI00072DE5A6|nr:PREDICTED: kinesin-like protein KIF20A isoform X1 [Poecilia latipinna]
MQPADMDLTGEFSVFSPSLQQTVMTSGAGQQMMQIYLRVRPFSKEELSANEDQDCVVIDDGQTVTLNAPKGSATMKSSEKGIGLSIHKFSFSKVFGPQTTQDELFRGAVRTQVFDFLEGENALIFSYGVTNAGKTFTIQGTPKDPGILPRVLDAVFSYIGGLQYHGMDLKPYLMNGIQFLDAEQVKQERTAKMTVLASVKEECDHQRLSSSPEPSISSDITLSSSSSSSSNNLAEAGGDQFALWVAFFEIYNECVYDLLQPSQSKKRSSLRVCDDGAGNAYVKDLKWINIQNLSEANKLLQFGNKNRSAAATKINQSSSRSHSIFTMKLLKIDGQTVERISEFSLCDLAGSERCNKAKTFGERLKEAGNINNSLLILGKCISALRSGQADGMKATYVPFRESKLTKLFQAFFCGKGRAAMIVNINQCASTYDETLHIMKFTAVAKQVVQVIPNESAAPSVPCLVGRDGKPLMRNGILEGYPSEDELFEEEDDVDMSLLPQNDLLNIIENLRTKFLAERKKNLVQEMEIRKEMGDAMLQQLLESEELRIRQAEELKESYAEKLENTFEMYKDAIKEHAYQCAMSNLEDNYVPLVAFTAEQEKAEALKRKVSELEDLLSSIGRGVSPVLRVDQWCQTEPLPDAGETDDRIKQLCQENGVLEKMCEDNKQMFGLQFILYLEKRLVDLSQTLQHVRDDFLEKSDDAEALRKTVDQQSKSMEEVLCQNAEKDEEIASLKAEIEKLSQKSPVQLKTRTRKGLLANIKDVVSSPRRGPSSHSLVKPPRTAKY